MGEDVAWSPIIERPVNWLSDAVAARDFKGQPPVILAPILDFRANFHPQEPVAGRNSVADEKGKFSTNISPEAIEAALAAVKRRSPAEGETTPDAEAPADAATGSEDAVALKKENEQLKVQLEFSQSKGRE